MNDRTVTRRRLLGGGRPSLAARISADSSALAGVLARAQLTDYTYAQVPGEVRFGPRTRTVLASLAGHEHAHVTRLAAAIRAAGGRVPAAPDSASAANAIFARNQVAGRLGELRSELDAFTLLLDLERLAVGASYAALITLDAPASARLVASIMASDAQHEALLGELMTPGDIAAVIKYGLVAGLQ